MTLVKFPLTVEQKVYVRLAIRYVMRSYFYTISSAKMPSNSFFASVKNSISLPLTFLLISIHFGRFFLRLNMLKEFLLSLIRITYSSFV